MTNKLLTHAASLAAIAAALTFANPALSQEGVAPQGDVAPAPASPVIVPPPVVSPPPATVDSIPPATAPQPNQFPTVTPPLASQAPAPAPSQQAPGVVYKPSAPVVQDVPVTEEVSPAEEAALDSPRATQRSTAQPTAAPRREAATAPTTSNNNTANDEVAETRSAAPAESGVISPLTAPADTGAANTDLAPPAAAPAEAQASTADLPDGVIVGGAAVLLLGTGGLLWAALRRRRPADRTARPVVAERSRTVDAPATAMAPLAVAPVAVSEPVRREEVSAVAATNTAAEPVAEAVAPVTPAEVHARDADTVVLERPAVRRTAAADTDLEAMVAARPDAANPFLTRRNRLRRAKYILEHGEYVSRPMTSRQEAPVAAAQAATSETRSRSQPPVYDFGKGAAPHKRPGWKPATST